MDRARTKDEVLWRAVVAVLAAGLSAYWASGGDLLAILGGVGIGLLVCAGWVVTGLLTRR